MSNRYGALAAAARLVVERHRYLKTHDDWEDRHLYERDDAIEAMATVLGEGK